MQNKLKGQQKWQYRKLFPETGECPKPIDTDITLLVNILSIIPTHLQPPTAGWSKKPESDDNTDGANIVRLKNMRNDTCLAHSTSATLQHDLFEEKWEEAEKVILALGGAKDDVGRIKNGDFGGLREMKIPHLSDKENFMYSWLDIYSFLDTDKLSL